MDRLELAGIVMLNRNSPQRVHVGISAALSADCMAVAAIPAETRRLKAVVTAVCVLKCRP
jgi:hypothetical protein